MEGLANETVDVLQVQGSSARRSARLTGHTAALMLVFRGERHPWGETRDRIMATGGTKQCPYCRETINKGARKCRHCGQMLIAPADTIDMLYPQMSNPARAADEVRAAKLNAAFYMPEDTADAADLPADDEDSKVLYVCPKCKQGFEAASQVQTKIRCPNPECSFEWFLRTGTLDERSRAHEREMVAQFAVVAGPDRGEKFRIVERTTLLGRGKSCHFRLSDPKLADQQARIALTDNVVWVYDNTGKGGMLINGQELSRSALTHGDMVTFGDTTLTLEVSWRAKRISAAVREAMTSDRFVAGADVFIGNKRVHSIPLGVGSVTFGRAGSRDVRLVSPLISRKHATIVYEGGRHHLIDNNSTQGTFVGDRPVMRRTLRAGDVVQMGPFVFAYKKGALIRQFPQQPG